MPSPIEQLFGIHAQALTLRSQRAELLATNLANADTPNYKAKDIDFDVAFKDAQGLQTTENVKVRTSQAQHISTDIGAIPANAIRYRVPEQASLDGNTVDSDHEKSAFTENALRYQISLSILSKKISGLVRTLRGE